MPTWPALLGATRPTSSPASSPISTTPQLRQNAHPLFRLKDVMGPTQILVLAARTPFIERNRAALVDYMEDFLRSLRWYLDPANHEAAVAIVADFTKQPAARFEPWLLTQGRHVPRPERPPQSRRRCSTTSTMQKEFGFLKIDST